jgi:hypothetical protein
MALTTKQQREVRTARRDAMSPLQRQGYSLPEIRQAGRQAARTQRQSYRPQRQTTPQPPAGSEGGGGPTEQGGYYQYTPTAESQLVQPYQDILAAGALGQLPGVFNRMNQQGQMGDIYAQGAAGSLGGAAAAMRPLSQLGQYATQMGGENLGGAQQQMQGLQNLGNQAQGLTGGTLGQYGQLMDPNLAIQQNLANQTQAVQAGAADFDPFLTQQFNQQEQQLREQLRRNLGPDYENSSPGIEALARFNQGKTTALGSAQFNRLQSLVGMQQGGLGNIATQGLGFGGFGAGIQGQQFGQGVQGTQLGAGIQGQQFGQGAQLGQMYGQNAQDLYTQALGLHGAQLSGQGQNIQNLGALQNLYAGVPQTMGEFGQAMSGQAGAAVGGQDPYQRDRMAQFQASYAPNKGQFAGQMMGQSGDRWVNVAGSSMGGFGGGGGSEPPMQG